VEEVGGKERGERKRKRKGVKGFLKPSRKVFFKVRRRIIEGNVYLVKIG